MKKRLVKLYIAKQIKKMNNKNITIVSSVGDDENKDILFPSSLESSGAKQDSTQDNPSSKSAGTSRSGGSIA